MKATLEHRQEFSERRPSKPDVESSSLSSPAICGQSSDTPNISRSEGLGRTAFCTIPLTRGQFATVSLQDYERVAAHSWYAMPQNGGSGRFYACSKGAWTGYKTFYLHRFILGVTGKQEADHINGDTLDCTRENLRVCTHLQNTHNRRLIRQSRLGFRGVRTCTHSKKFEARIIAYGVVHYLGRFQSPVVAARAYDTAARQLHGDYAVLNFPASAPRPGA